jgi:ADP-ribosylglycohydrolase
MRAFGTHQQPLGTWSDDSSLLFCTAESLLQGFDLIAIADNFKRWYQAGHWTPHGVVFDIGNATVTALHKLQRGVSPTASGGTSPQSNGNGSLMRILPLALTVRTLPMLTRWQQVSAVSAITHAHIRSCWACFMYIEYALKLMAGMDKQTAYHALKTDLATFLAQHDRLISADELALFNRLLIDDIQVLTPAEISGSGYVLHTLEAAIWCLLTTKSYTEAVLQAVNLGDDTDTTGAVTGGLAGLYYGMAAIPPLWLTQLVKRAEIQTLAEQLAAATLT